ncbi:hypothetical protein F4782DRAFT_445122 [Xylaria castorea]|nr:hypothetical protein F4782DRAFT_445122 [Xylaria castorea]
MEAFATLSFVGNVIQLVEVSTKLVKTTIKLANSASEVPDEINDATLIRDSLVSLLQAMRVPGSTRSEHDRQLTRLAEGCQKVCRELLDQVNHIKGTGNSSKTGVFGVAWRTLTDGGKLNSIEQRLDRYRSQILAHIIVMLDHKQSATYTLIESSFRQQNAHTQSLRGLIDKTKDNIIEAIKAELNNAQSNTGGARAESVQDNGPVAPSLERTIPEHSNYEAPHDFNVPSEAHLDILVAVRAALATIAQASKAVTIQDWLYFPELLSRESAIHNAHENTYTWLLHDEDSNEDIEEDHRKYRHDSYRELERSQNRDAMCNWLKSGSGIFHISGKAGSGKSTLMKYLAGAPETREHLTNWAKTKEKDLIFAEFFFWRSGTPLQRDIEGLYRGILWKILDAHPDFIQDVSSTFREDKNGVFDGSIHRSKPTLSELEAAFNVLIQSPKALSKHRICLFIDGLDEFEGDYWTLSQRLAKWCASNDIKICVSSRPQNEFTKVFNAVPGATWFSLHGLTRPDMLHFVRNTFEKDLRYAEACVENPGCRSLFYSIVDRADGVFLWVRLVVNELLVDMGNSWSFVQLKQRLDEIPSDLRSLFNQMLRRVNRLERVKLARTFLLLNLESEIVGLYGSRIAGRSAMSVYAHAVLDDIADNPDLEVQLLDGSPGPYLSKADCISKCSQMRRRLIGRCQGLLDIDETNRPFPYCHTASFCHRSVAEFLKEPEVESDIQELVRSFDPRRALAHILLAEFKFVRPYENPPYHLDHRLISLEDDEKIKGDGSDKFREVTMALISLSTDNVSLFDEVDCIKRMARQMECSEKWFWFEMLDGDSIFLLRADLDSVVLWEILSASHAGELAGEVI